MASKHKLDFVGSELRRIKEDGLYRRLQHGRVRGAHITIGGKRLLNLCSNDYLGMPATRMQAGQLQSSSRLVSGNDQAYEKLEGTLARHKSQQDSLVFPTGYMANLGAVTALAKEGDLVLSDELNHASIIEACRLSGARVSIYGHNDMPDLQKKLKQKGQNKFVITEGIFSMDGDFAPLRQIVEASEKAGAVTVIDDAHGDFAVGGDGRGTPDYFGVAKKIDVYVSSLSKGLGSFGGYVASKNGVIDLCINRAKPFIYTSALPSFLAEHAAKRLGSDREKQRRKLDRNTKNLARGLRQIGYEISSETHIIPIIIGGERAAVNFGRYLQDNGIFAQPIRYPTVQKNQARLRVSVTAWLSDADIRRALEVFERAYPRIR